MEIYPSGYLPSPLFSYSVDSEETIEILEFEAGNRRNVRHSSNIREMVQVEFLYTNDQMAFFRGWHKHKINQGADTFLMDLVLNDELDRFEVTITDGNYGANRASDTYWNVTFGLFLEDTHIMSEEDLDALLDA